MKEPESLLRPEAALDLLKSLPVGILLSDPQGTILWVNDALCTQFQCAAAELIGRSRHKLPAKRILTLFKGVETYHVAAKGEQGDRWLSSVWQPLDLKGGDGWEAVCTVDITHYEQARKRRYLSLIPDEPIRIDPNTGLLTEKSVMAHLVSEVSRSRRYNNPLSAILINLGPARQSGPVDAAEGLPLLLRVARVLKERLRWVDITGRWREHGILVVLPETNIEGAAHLAGKLRAEIENELQAEPESSEPLPPRCIGVTQWRKGDDAVSLIDRICTLLTEQSVPGAENIAVG